MSNTQHTPGPKIAPIGDHPAALATAHLAAQLNLLDVVEACATLMAAPVNRFGKPEFYDIDTRAARELIQTLAVRYQVGPSDTILHQAAKVLRAAKERI